MNPFLRFCFHPAPRDRIWWSLFSLVMTLVTLVTSIVLFYIGHVWPACFNALMTGWNGLGAWFNFEIYQHWKKYGHLPEYEYPPKK